MKTGIKKQIKLIDFDFNRLISNLKENLSDLEKADIWDLDEDTDKLSKSETLFLLLNYETMQEHMTDFKSIMNDLGLGKLVKKYDEELEQFKIDLNNSYNIANDNQKEIINLIFHKIVNGEENSFKWRKGKYLDDVNECLDWDWLEKVKDKKENK